MHCSSATHQLIASADHAAVQISIAKVRWLCFHLHSIRSSVALLVFLHTLLAETPPYQVDSTTGRATGENFSYAFSGKIRQQVGPSPFISAAHLTFACVQGESDDSLNRLAQEDGILFKFAS